MADTAADVPDKFDIIIDGHGYILAREIDPNLPFRTQRARYSFSPTFVTRQNTSGSYGDNQQDFWLTETQNDWSLGEGQKFFRPADPESKRAYWLGGSIDISLPGQVKLAQSVKSNISWANPVVSAYGVAYTTNVLYAIDSTQLYAVTDLGVKSTLGAHGAGTPYSRGMTSDGNRIYIAGTTAIRTFTIVGATFATFNASAFMALCYSGNTLYGIDSVMSSFYHFDTAGTATALYTWKDGSGNPRGLVTSLKSFGGKILALRASSEEFRGSTLWEWDGTGMSQVAELPPNFRGDTMEVASGIIFIAGAFFGKFNSQDYIIPAIYYVANGTQGLLWKASTRTTYLAIPSMVAFQGGLVFTDELTGNIMYYDVTSGAISSIGAFTPSAISYSNSSSGVLAASGNTFLHARQSTTTYFFPDGTAASAGQVYSSLFDFDSSLTKLFRAIIVEFEPGADGNGGSVDVAYQVNSVDGAYTTLATGVTSGQENLLSNIMGRSLSVKVTLNKGTSTLGPTLKRVYVRAAPVQQTFRNDELILDCSGVAGKTPVILNNDNPHNLMGEQMVLNLRAAITSTTPIQVSDEFGTYTAIIEPENADIIERNPQEYLVRLTLREV